MYSVGFKNVVFIIDYSYTSSKFLNKFGYEWFKTRGFKVSVIDLSFQQQGSTKVGVNSEWVCVDSLLHLKEIIVLMDKQKTVFFKIISVNMKLYFDITKLMSELELIVVEQRFGQIPISSSPFISRTDLNLLGLFLKVKSFLYSRAAQLLLKNTILIYAGSIPNSVRKRYKECWPTNSSDFNSYLNVRGQNGDHLNYSVFLDEYAPFHVDISLLKQHLPVPPSTYYVRLNQFFDRFEKISGTKIIIAAHPSADYSKFWNPFNNREVIYDGTPNLVQHATYVLGHSSTSFSYAVLFMKPCIFILDSTSYSLSFNRGILSFAQSLEALVVDLKFETIEGWKDLKVNSKKYIEYRRNYIREDDVPEENSFEIISQQLNNYFKRKFES